MADDKALKVWEHWPECSERLDYFILGASSAPIACIGQRLPVAPIGLNVLSLELGSVVALALTTVAAVERLRATVAGLDAQQVVLDAANIAG